MSKVTGTLERVKICAHCREFKQCLQDMGCCNWPSSDHYFHIIHKWHSSCEEFQDKMASTDNLKDK